MTQEVLDQVDQSYSPYVVRWVETVDHPVGSADWNNPDTSTVYKSTEDNDT
jgi:hypothetical protein